MTRILFSTLFKRDKNLGMENDLASSYEVSEDLLTWKVKLREDVLFTDVEKLTSKDVVYTYEKASIDMLCDRIVDLGKFKDKSEDIYINEYNIGVS